MSKYLNIVNEKDDKAVINIVGFIGNRWWKEEGEEETVVSREELNEELKNLGGLKAKNIELNIDSLGGDVFHATAMYNILAKLDANITVNYVGHSASSATHFIGLGKTKVAENVTLLMHEASSGAWGNAEDMKALAQSLDNMSDTIGQTYANKSGMSLIDARARMKRGNGGGIWDTAQEWLELGLIDEIYSPIKAVASADNNKFANYGLPKFDNKQLVTDDLNNYLNKLKLKLDD